MMSHRFNEQAVDRLVVTGVLRIHSNGTKARPLVAPIDAPLGVAARHLENLALRAENDRLRRELADANDQVAALVEWSRVGSRAWTAGEAAICRVLPRVNINTRHNALYVFAAPR